MFNAVTLSGRLTADPELKTTTSGTAVTSFSIAVDRPVYKDGEKKTDFIKIVAWRGNAEFISKYFRKGSLIGIEGSIQTRNYEDKNGNARVAFEVIANKAHFLEKKRDNDEQANFTPSYQNADTSDFSEIGTDDEDLPF